MDIKQPDLFGADEPRQRAAMEERRQRRMEAADRAKETREARRLADEGMKAVAAKAEEITPGWSQMAYDALLRFAKVRTLFTGEDVKRWAYDNGLPKPHNEAAWGAVFAKARRRKVTALNGYVVANSASRHAAPNRQWKSLIFGE